MSTYFLRRRGLGLTSCNEITNASQHIRGWFREDHALPASCDTVIRWGCTATLPSHLRVFNKAEAIHLINNKREFRRTLDGMGLTPTTFFALQNAQEHPELFPMVVRPSTHAQGRNLWVANTPQELSRIVYTHLGNRSWYASQYINKVAEYRCMVVQGRIAWVAQKTPGNPTAVAWNVARGGRFDNVRWKEWPLEACKVACHAFWCCGLDFGGVDVMVDAAGRAYVLEINSAPSQTSPYRQSCSAKAFDWMLEQKPVEQFGNKASYTSYIHPAVKESE